MKVKSDSHSQLPQSKILLLESISANRTIGAYNAQAILSTYYGHNFPLIVETASGLEYREKAEDEKELNLHLTTLVPNPTNNSVIISTNIKSKFISSVSILSLDGRELMKSSFKGIHSTENIDVSQLNPGIFIIKLETNSGLNPELIKLIKE